MHGPFPLLGALLGLVLLSAKLPAQYSIPDSQPLSARDMIPRVPLPAGIDRSYASSGVHDAVPGGPEYFETDQLELTPWEVAQRGEPSSAMAPSGVPLHDKNPDAYVDLDYILWWLGDTQLPRILTQNPLGTPWSNISSVHDASTQTLIGNESVGDWAQSGMRLRAGRFFRDRLLSRLEFTGWFLFDGSDDWNFASQHGTPILARPFTNALTGQPDAQLLSLPGVADGTLAARYQRRLYAFDPLASFCLTGNGCSALELLAGYRFLRYEDKFRIVERVQPQASSLVVPGTEFLVEDSFRARNDFHVFPLGLNYLNSRDAWRFDVRALVALGFVHQQVSIRGRTDVVIPGEPTTSSPSGFLALPSNIGNHERTEFAWIPEINANLRRCLRGGLWAHVGYSLVYLNDVVRAPDHIATTLDTNLLPPALAHGTQPAFQFQSSEQWIHGLNAGLQWNY